MKQIAKFLIVMLLCLSFAFAMSACDEALLSDETTADAGEETKDAPTADNATEAGTDAPSTPSVTVPAGTKNALVIRFTEFGNNTVTATVSVEGDVSFAGLTGDLNYDAAVLSVASAEPILGGMVVNANNTGAISFSYASISNLTSAQDLFKVTFSYSNSGALSTDLSFTIEDGNFSNAALENVPYTVFGAALNID